MLLIGASEAVCAIYRRFYQSFLCVMLAACAMYVRQDNEAHVSQADSGKHLTLRER